MHNARIKPDKRAISIWKIRGLSTQCLNLQLYIVLKTVKLNLNFLNIENRKLAVDIQEDIFIQRRAK